MSHAARVVVAALVGVILASPAAAQNDITERFSKTAHLDQNGTFDLTNVTGDIVITGTAGRDVTIEAVKRVQRPNPRAARALLAMIDIQVTEQANRLEVRTIVPRPRNFPGSVDFTVSVPEDANVIVKTITGSIRASNVKGELRADTVAGSISASGVRKVAALKCVTGDVEIADAGADDAVTASTVSGNVIVRGLRARAVQLTSVSGNIHIEDAQVERMMVKTVQGNLDYAGELARSGRYEFNSHSGDIRLVLSGNTGFEVLANTFSGSVRSDFTFNRGRAGTEGAGVQGPRTLRGAFGDASAMVALRAFSGNISLARR
jgi:putative adhesin